MSDDRRKLRRTIFWQIGELGLTEDDRHEIQVSICGFESMKDATKEALIKMVSHLKERGKGRCADPQAQTKTSSRRKSRRPTRSASSNVDRMITPEQRQTIKSWMEWKNLSDAYVRGISKKLCRGKDFPTTTREASALIRLIAGNRIPSQNTTPTT